MKKLIHKIYYWGLLLSPVAIVTSFVGTKNGLLTIGLLLLSSLLLMPFLLGIGVGDFAVCKPSDMPDHEIEEFKPVVRPNKGMGRYIKAELEREMARSLKGGEHGEEQD